MALPSFARLVVTVKRARLVDDHGTQVRDWATTDDHLIAGCSWQPSAGQVITDRRDAEQGAGILYLPPGCDLLATDRVVVDDTADEYTVQGRPQRVTSASGALDHTVAVLSYWEG